MPQKKSGPWARRLGILILIGAAFFAMLASFRAGPAPEISIEAALPGIGKRTPIQVVVDEPKRGLSEVRIEFVQGARVERLQERTYTPRAPWELWGERTPHDEFSFAVGSETLERLEDGPASIRVVAKRASSWLRYPGPVVRELPLEVRLRPPVLQVTSAFTYVKQGGCEAVVYAVGESSVQDGVQAGGNWFPGFPLPGGGERQRFALFAVPFDLADPERVVLVARDAVGNEARLPFIDQFTPRAPGTDRIQVSDSFLQRVVPPIVAQSPGFRDRGNLLENYLAINNELRRQSSEVLTQLGSASAQAFLWKRAFLPMRNAKVTSDFADRRTYLYQGREIDEQFHLGFDLASTRAAEIQAANDGVVKLARYFGIFGNAVVIDHGYGLMSLYGHLSSIAVSEGESVARGQVIGRSGQTGLAGGDHLHFTMLLRGLPVDSREWWDGHWIHDRLVLKLGAALPFEG